MAEGQFSYRKLPRKSGSGHAMVRPVQLTSARKRIPFISLPQTGRRLESEEYPVAVVMCAFAGVLVKTGVFLWCFGGENVVDCVVNVVFWQPLFGAGKCARFWGFILVVPFLGMRLGGAAVLFLVSCRRPLGDGNARGELR
jgi:hypothetical protein